jgi:predicted nucleic acid-binding protein
VSRIVLLDAGPLGLVTHPKLSSEGALCTQWIGELVRQGGRVIVPEIADYEVRRELLRANKIAGVERLDQLSAHLEYLPLSTAAMRQAARLWALARQKGIPTASDKAIDGDMILAGQALTLGSPQVVVATTNVGHLERWVPAAEWRDIA